MEYLLSVLNGLLHNNQFFQGGLVLGAISAVFYQLKAVPATIFGKLKYWASFAVHFDEQTDFYSLFNEWFKEKYPRKYRNVEVKMDADTDAEYFRRTERNWKLTFLQFTDTNFIWYHNRLIWVTKLREKLEAAHDADNAYRNSYSLVGLFARNAINHLCNEILQRRLDEIHAKGLRIAVRNTYNSDWDIHNSRLVKGFDQLFFENKQQVIDDLTQFAERKEFYDRRRINYKRCYLFYGPGGTGKSSLAAAIADYLGHDLYVVNLADLKSDKALLRLAREIPPRSTIVMEDIDCILSKRKVSTDKLNFSSVLNFLDGPTAPTECVMIMTTNHPEKLDEALTRKGRVDLALKIGYPRPQDASEFMTEFYGEPVVIPGKTRLSIPMSEVQEICIQHPVNEARKLIQRRTRRG